MNCISGLACSGVESGSFAGRAGLLAANVPVLFCRKRVLTTTRPRTPRCSACRFRTLRLECLSARLTLSTTYYLDPSATTWGGSVWHTPQPNSMPETIWVNSAASNAVIEGATSATTITVSNSVTAGTIAINGPYTLTGGTIAAATSITGNVQLGTTAEIDSQIAGAAQLVATGTGTLIVGSAANTYKWWNLR